MVYETSQIAWKTHKDVRNQVLQALQTARLLSNHLQDCEDVMQIATHRAGPAHWAATKKIFNVGSDNNRNVLENMSYRKSHI